jgi:hypothetical protein
MPALEDQDLPIRAATLVGRAHPVHPSPSQDGLALEIMSNRELAYWGQQFGIDTPYLIVPAGWGEWLPVVDT